MLTTGTAANILFVTNFQSAMRIFLLSLSMSIVLVCAGPALSSEMRFPMRNIMFAEAQCKATCYKTYLDDLKNSSLTLDLRKRLERIEIICTDRPSCNRCANVGCNSDPQIPDCRIRCEGEVFCLIGCLRIRQLMTLHPCPIAQTHNSCSKPCYESDDCGTHQHCCPTSSLHCDRSCAAIGSVDVTSLPPIPKFNLQWKAENNSFFVDFPLLQHGVNATHPIVFVIQYRYVISDEFDAEDMSPWGFLTQTTRRMLVMNGMVAGSIYQVRAAAVSHLGTLGYGKPSLPVRLPRNPHPPNTPRNVTDGVWRIYATGKVNVSIHWMEPKKSDLPINLYKIIWVRDHGVVQSDGKSLVAFTEYSTTMPPNSFTYVIPHLDPSTAYKIEVRAVSQWGRQRLESRPNRIYINTPKVGDSRTKETKTSFSATGCRCHDPLRNLGTEFTILKPMFDGKSLVVTINKTDAKDYKVEWSPRVCIDSQSQSSAASLASDHILKEVYTYTLKNLQFNCRYALKITPLNSNNNEKVFNSCFCTASCHETMIQSGLQRRNVCPLPTEPELIPPPSSLRIVRKDNIGEVFEVNWESQKHLNKAITNYRIVWGPRLDEPVNQESYSLNGLQAPLDVSRAETRVLDRSVTSFTLKNLKRATLYIVKVQALSFIIGRESESLEARTIFTTPGFPHYPVKMASMSGEVSKYVKQPLFNNAMITVWSNVTLLTLCLLTQWILPT